MTLIPGFCKRHTWLTGILLTLILFISLLPIAIKYTAISLLEKQTQLAVTIDDVDVNLFTGELAVKNFAMLGSNSSTRVARFEAKLKLSALFEKRLQFTSVTLSQSQLPIKLSRQGEQNQISIAGITLPQGQTSEQTNDASPTFGFGIDELHIKAIDVTLQQEQLQQDFHIRSLSLRNLHSWDPNFARLILHSSLDKNPINANLQLHLFQPTPKLIGTLSMQDFPLDTLREVTQLDLAGKVSGDLTFTLEQYPDASLRLYQYSEIKLTDAQLPLPKQNISTDELTWKGDIHYVAGDIQAIRLTGKLNGRKLAFSQAADDLSSPIVNVSADLNANLNLIGQLNGKDAKIQQNGALIIQDLAFKNRSNSADETGNKRLDLTLKSKQLKYTGDLEYNLDNQQAHLKGRLDSDEVNLSANTQVTTQSERLKLTYQAVNFDGKFDWSNQTQQALIDGTLLGKGVNLNQDSTQAFTTIAVNNVKLAGKHQLSLQKNTNVTTKSELSIEQFDLHQKTPNNEAPQNLQLNNNLKANLNLAFEQSAEQLSLKQDGKISLSKINFQQPATQLSSNLLAYEGKLSLIQAEKKPLKLALKGQLKGTGIDLAQNQPEAQLTLKQNLFADLDLLLTSAENQLEVAQKGEIQASALQFNQQTQQQNLEQTIQQLDYKGSIQLKTLTKEASQDLALKGKLTIDSANTDLQPKETLASPLQLSSNLQSDFALALTNNAQGLTLNYEGSGKITRLVAANQDQQLQLKMAQWSGNSQLIQPSAETDHTPTLNVDLGLSASNFALGSRQLMPQDPAISMAYIKVNNLQLQNTQNLTLKGLELNKFAVNGVKNNQLTPVSTFDQLSIDSAQANLTALDFTFGEVILNNSKSFITLDQSQQLVQINALKTAFNLPITSQDAVNDKANKPASEQQTDSSDKTPTDTAFELPIKLQLKQFALSGDHRIEFDWQTQPAIKKSIQINQLQVNAVNSLKPEQATTYQFEASLDEFAKITSKGTAKPFLSEILVTDLTQIDSLQLNDFSPFVEEKVGYQINSGQLSATIKTQIADNKLDIENDIKLYKFDLSSEDNAKTEEFNQNFQMPLNVGLGLLKDKNDNIELKLPIKGDLNNPNFDINNIIATAVNGALGKATRTYLLLALQPFGAIALAGEFALDQVSAVQLQAIEFAHGKDFIEGKMPEYLNKVATLLKSKPGVQIKLCGGANQSDKLALEEIEKLKKAQQKPTQTSETIDSVTDINKALLELAGKRQANIKRYLIAQGVNSNQIVICQPKVSAEQGVAKVQMGI